MECDALVVGGGFAGVFMFWSLKKEGLDVVMYEAGTDLGGTWRWNCYRKSVAKDDLSHMPTMSSWCYGRLRGTRVSTLHPRGHRSVSTDRPIRPAVM